MMSEFIQAQTDHIFIINVFFSVFLTGLIWVIQLVHYPLFLDIGSSDFQNYERNHQKRITPLVAPVMVADLTFSILMLFTELVSNFGIWLYLAFAPSVLMFLSTWLVFAPLHHKLGKNHNPDLIKKLVRLNFFRTFGWTAKSLILIFLLKESLI